MIHGEIATSYRRGCRCLSCSRTEALRNRAYYEKACADCGGPTWGVRCFDCWRLDRSNRAVKPRRSIQPKGLRYEWGCP